MRWWHRFVVFLSTLFCMILCNTLFDRFDAHSHAHTHCNKFKNENFDTLHCFLYTAWYYLVQLVHDVWCISKLNFVYFQIEFKTHAKKMEISCAIWQRKTRNLIDFPIKISEIFNNKDKDKERRGGTSECVTGRLLIESLF